MPSCCCKGINGDDLLEEISQTDIDLLYSLITNYELICDENRALLMAMMVLISSTAVETIGASSPVKTKNAFKIILFFFISFCVKAESMCTTSALPPSNQESKSSKGNSKKKKSCDWIDYRARCLAICLSAIQIQPSIVWSMGVVQDCFLCTFWKYALHLLETRPAGVAGSSGQEVAVRSQCVSLLIACAPCFQENSALSGSSSLAASLVHSLCGTEHMAVVVAEICAKSKGALLSNVMSDISRMHLGSSSSSSAGTISTPLDDVEAAPSDVPSSTSRSNAPSSTSVFTVKNIGSFFVSLTEMNPQACILYFPVVLAHLASDAFQIRCVLMNLIRITYVYFKSTVGARLCSVWE